MTAQIESLHPALTNLNLFPYFPGLTSPNCFGKEK